MFHSTLRSPAPVTQPEDRARLSVAILALFFAFAPGPACSEDGDAPGGATGPAVAAEPRGARAGLETLRPLLSEVQRAELQVDGLLIDFGTADQHKYTLGGWGNGWGRSEVEQGTTYAKAMAKSVPLGVVISGAPVEEVVLRVRGRLSGQVVSLYVDGKPIAGGASVAANWGITRVMLPEPIELGRHHLNLVFRKATAEGESADVDWVWLSRTAGANPPTVLPRQMPVSVGGKPRRALIAPTPRTYGFYLQVPEAASLVFDHGANTPTEFLVQVAEDGKEQTVFQNQTKPGAWQEAVVDLSPFAGRAVRLEFETRGGGGAGAGGVVGWGEPELMRKPDAAKTRAASGPAKTARNAIIILIDTIRADVFDVIQPKSGVRTPTYDALAKESTVFVNSYCNENWTKPSVASLLTGLYPTTHGAKNDTDVLSGEVELLPERLREAGFRTAGFIANGYCSDKFGFKQGWDTYRNYIREKRLSSAESVYGDALAWVKDNKDERFFLYVHTIDPHVPYRRHEGVTEAYHPGEYKGWLGPSVEGGEQAKISKGKKKASEADLRWVRALYKGEVTYHDLHMGKFLDELRALGIADDTLLVVTNDHGEELHDHGALGHGHSLYEELLRSPLLMRLPSVFPAGTTVEEVVESVDVLPTVLELLGQPPAPYAEGISVLPLVQGQTERPPTYAVAEFLAKSRAIRVGNWKLIATPRGARLFDVVDDPDEQKDVAQDRPLARRFCEVHLSEALATPAKGRRHEDITERQRFKSGTVKMDPELKKHLEALGYLGGD